jgi:putative ABC transport system permease protein
MTSLKIPGEGGRRGAAVDFAAISPDYFRAIGVRLITGRLFTTADTASLPPVAILGNSAAARFFPGKSAVGQVVTLTGTKAPVTVVGVVADSRFHGPENTAALQCFVPLAQSPAATGTLVLRTTSPSTVLPEVRSAIWSEFPDAPIGMPQTLTQAFGSLVAERRFNMLLLTIFGALGVAIAAIGIYGVMAYVVAERTREIGIRIALGAQTFEILMGVVGRAAIYLGVGLVLGLAGAWKLAVFTKAFLFQIDPHDGLLYAAAAALIVLAGLAAAFVPARRAARVDPIVALRAE